MADPEADLSLNRPIAEILTIGTELLTGSALNTNAAFLALELTQLGFWVHAQVACLDEPEAIRRALGSALSRSDVILVSGGLGPTPDDVTRQAVADFFKVPLVLSKTQYRMIRTHYRKRGRRVPALVKQEACFPANAKPLFNRYGIALGFAMEEKERLVIVLPGVPGELTRLFAGSVKSLLKRKFSRVLPPFSLVVKTAGVSEPEIMNRLGARFFKLGRFQFGIYPEAGEVALRLYCDSSSVSQRLKKYLIQKLRSDIYSFSDEPIEAVIGRELRARHWTISLAESCTGGRVSDRITRVPGASRYLSGSVVAYRPETKIRILGISESIAKNRAAVSQGTALAMARGCRARFQTTLGVAVTGIAGPSGGTRGKPVGLVFMAIVSERKERSWREFFAGDREQIQERATKKVLELLWRWLQR